MDSLLITEDTVETAQLRYDALVAEFAFLEKKLEQVNPVVREEFLKDREEKAMTEIEAKCRSEAAELTQRRELLDKELRAVDARVEKLRHDALELQPETFDHSELHARFSALRDEISRENTRLTRGPHERLAAHANALAELYQTRCDVAQSRLRLVEGFRHTAQALEQTLADSAAQQATWENVTEHMESAQQNEIATARERQGIEAEFAAQELTYHEGATQKWEQLEHETRHLAALQQEHSEAVARLNTLESECYTLSAVQSAEVAQLRRQIQQEVTQKRDGLREVQEAETTRVQDAHQLELEKLHLLRESVSKEQEADFTITHQLVASLDSAIEGLRQQAAEEDIMRYRHVEAQHSVVALRHALSELYGTIEVQKQSIIDLAQEYEQVKQSISDIKVQTTLTKGVGLYPGSTTGLTPYKTPRRLQTTQTFE